MRRLFILEDNAIFLGHLLWQGESIQKSVEVSAVRNCIILRINGKCIILRNIGNFFLVHLTEMF